MRVVYTEEAARNLHEIADYLAQHYPTIAAKVAERLRAATERIANWPESAQAVHDHPDVRLVPLIRYPYKIYYRVVDETVEILYIHHASRQEPWADTSRRSDAET